MANHHLISLLCIAYFYLLQATAQIPPSRNISTALFNSLEELSRLVDVSYCVGTTGIQKPFQCLSRCDEFPDLELVRVSTVIFPKMIIRLTNFILDMEYRAPPLRFMRVHRPLPRSISKTHHHRLPGNVLHHKYHHRSLRLSAVLCPLSGGQ